MTMTDEEFRQRQMLPLEQKVVFSQQRIKQWYDYWHGDVYVSISGGKDSTVLLDVVRSTVGVYDVPAVFCDTGLEYPEVRNNAIKLADVVIKPKMTFKQVIEKYGYPFPSKEQALYIRQANHSSPNMRNLRMNGYPPNGRFGISDRWKFLVDSGWEVSETCCDVMKKRPFHEFEKESGLHPFIGTMANESRIRHQEYMNNGCNAFDKKNPSSTPIAFWTNQDILRYVKENGLELPSVYGEIVADDMFGEHLTLTGCKRTGCMFCMFGVANEQEPNRFQQMRNSHPKQYRYCMDKLGLGEFLDFVGVKH